MTLAEAVTRACTMVALVKANRMHEAYLVVAADPAGIVGAMETLSAMHKWSRPKRECPQCKQVFEASRVDAMFCSKRCASNWHYAWETHPKKHTTCDNCGAAFVADHRRGRFCSKSCRVEAWHSVSNATRASNAVLLADWTYKLDPPVVRFTSALEEARAYIASCRRSNATVSSEVCRDIALAWGMGRGEAARLVRDAIEEIGLGDLK